MKKRLEGLQSPLWHGLTMWLLWRPGWLAKGSAPRVRPGWLSLALFFATTCHCPRSSLAPGQSLCHGCWIQRGKDLAASLHADTCGAHPCSRAPSDV